jgi:hypothetical protein
MVAISFITYPNARSNSDLLIATRSKANTSYQSSQRRPDIIVALLSHYLSHPRKGLYSPYKPIAIIILLSYYLSYLYKDLYGVLILILGRLII